MDNNPQTTKPISDDPELAKVLAGVSQQTDQALQFDTPQADPAAPADQPSDTPADNTQPAMTAPLADDNQPASAQATPDAEQTPVTEPAESNPYATEPLPEPTAQTAEPAVEPLPQPAMPTVTSSSDSDDLSSIKKEALNDLRPLVGKLEIAPEEKFDTYLLLIRSTDDKSLIEPAYAAAQAITDESRKAQALLDVIKEIDYLSNPPQ